MRYHRSTSVLTQSSSRSYLFASEESAKLSDLKLLEIGLRQINRGSINLDLVDGAGEWEGRFVVCADG
jgi:hypothetical protein